MKKGNWLIFLLKCIKNYLLYIEQIDSIIKTVCEYIYIYLIRISEKYLP